MKGSVVNVPVEVETTLNMLPRNWESMETINVNLKRRLDFTNPYMKNEVHPKLILNALTWLKDQPLFKKNNIKVDLSKYSQYMFAKTTDTMDMNDPDAADLPEETVDPTEEADPLGYNKTTFGGNQDINNDILLDQDNRYSRLLGNGVHEMAHGQYANPVAMGKDRDAEALTFLKLYGGQAMPFGNDKHSLQCVYKSYVRRHDRRFATNTQWLFYAYRKLMEQKLNNAIVLALKKNVKTANVTAATLLNDTEAVNKFMQSDDANRFLKTIRAAPQFWEEKKRDAFAMIRQLGDPTFFITTSPSEIDWPELIIILAKVLDNRTITRDDALTMTAEDRKLLVQRDPVTTSRYFEHRMLSLQSYVRDKNVGPFNQHPVIAYFARIEFQARGSPHLHQLVWLKDAPKLDMSKQTSIAKCIEFIDMYITAHVPREDRIYDNSDDERGVRMSYQKHTHYTGQFDCQKHSFKSADYEKFMENLNADMTDDEEGDAEDEVNNADDNDGEPSDPSDKTTKKPERKLKAFCCKRGFPWPIIDETLILAPFSKDERRSNPDMIR